MPHTLVILNRLDIVQATVRALQFKPQLRDAEFMLRTPAWAVRLESWWPRRRALRWPADWLGAAGQRRNESRILRRTADARVVYNVGVPSFEFHRQLVAARERHGFRLVTDMVDAQWLPWFRQFGWGHIDRMLAESDAVFVTNRPLAEYARRHNADVQIIPDAPQVEAFDAQRATFRPATGSPPDLTSVAGDGGLEHVGPTRPGRPIRLGWIGGRDTVFSLHKIHEALEQVAAARPNVELRVLGAPEDRLPRFEQLRWSTLERYDQAAMVREGLQMDIGLFPQHHVTESVCRGALKTKIYMAAGAVAISERLGENEEIIVDHRNGLLADSVESWRDAMLWLIDQPERRAAIAAQALEDMRAHFSAARVGAQLQAALEQVGRGGSGGVATVGAGSQASRAAGANDLAATEVDSSPQRVEQGEDGRPG